MELRYLRPGPFQEDMARLTPGSALKLFLLVFQGLMGLTVMDS